MNENNLVEKEPVVQAKAVRQALWETKPRGIGRNVDIYTRSGLAVCHDVEYSLAQIIKNAHNSELDAAMKVCELYFNIAAEAIGEDEVRRRRDASNLNQMDSTTASY
jgi:hypothetical protein